ncbi:MAG: tRNA (N6-isopentenyl adenosine(37)-C2)-methylthiotransferase MiaB [Defluviitaleaceae bacterium]|nr:tRNA (N6-isopentenyl adenosine(37)-C2)-methylthiotransferase MiaB [Defluviitaleaceae bacterium]
MQKETSLTDNYIQKIYEKWCKAGKKPKLKCVTYGCQANVHDSEKICGLLYKMGYEACESEEEADLIVYNTCCVRENAENRVFGNLGQLKKLKAENKDLKIILCGCMVQQDAIVEKIRKSYPFVDVIFGTFNLHRFPELLYTNIETNSQIIDIWQDAKEIADDLPAMRQHKFKASVNIMHGCDNFCSYCIVPYVRGRERSRPPEAIIKEIEALAADGVVEVTLLGQNVNSYGKGLESNINFADLINKVAKITGLKRIRFLTSHPKDFSDELIAAIKNNSNICKSVHLPLQSGSTAVLDRMNRKYTKESYLALVKSLRDAVSNIAITTDIITGFPYETDEDNEETIDVLKKVRFSGAFTFIYSKRSGTPAAAMDCQIDEETTKRRFDKILNALNPIIYEISQSHIGHTYEVLAEEPSKSDDTLITGRLDDNSLVHFKGDTSLIGQFVTVKITDCKTFYLIGEIIE